MDIAINISGKIVRKEEKTAVEDIGCLKIYKE
jgi:hypothetical protein